MCADQTGTLNNYGISWRIMENPGRSWRTMAHHGISWRVMEDHEESLKIMEKHGRSLRTLCRSLGDWLGHKSQDRIAGCGLLPSCQHICIQGTCLVNLLLMFMFLGCLVGRSVSCCLFAMDRRAMLISANSACGTHEPLYEVLCPLAPS